MRARVAPIAGANLDRVIEIYRHSFPGATPSDQLITILTDSNRKAPQAPSVRPENRYMVRSRHIDGMCREFSGGGSAKRRATC
jgi:hypothetical protein